MKDAKTAWLLFLRFGCMALLSLGVVGVGGCALPPPKSKTSAEVLREIEPGYRVFRADRQGLQPVVLVLHAASDRAWTPDSDALVRRLVASGYGVVFIDSYTGRGISGSSLRAGALLPAERAADLLVTIEWAARQPWIDPKRIAVFGHSHGATTILDALVLAPPDNKPTGLVDPPAEALRRVKGAVVRSPWCVAPILGNELVKSVRLDWSIETPLLAFLPTADTVSDPMLCRNALERAKGRNSAVEVVYYQGARHNFPISITETGQVGADYRSDLAEDSFLRTIAFLRNRIGE